MKSYLLLSVILMTAFDSMAGKYPLVIAHRGGAQLKLENTLPAFRHAFAIGADGIELDVQLSKDGELIVYHDDTLTTDFTTDSGGKRIKPGIKIADLTLKELQSYNLGDIDPNSKYAKDHPKIDVTTLEKIPTLGEVLETVPVGKAILIELKIDANDKNYQDLVEKVVVMIRRKGLQSSALVISFNWRALDYLWKTAPDIKRCYLTYNNKAFNPTEKVITDIPTTLAQRKHPYWGANHDAITVKQFDNAKEMKIGLIPWMANDDKSITKLIDNNVVGITTDRPDIMIAIIKKKEEDLLNAIP